MQREMAALGQQAIGYASTILTEKAKEEAKAAALARLAKEDPNFNSLSAAALTAKVLNSEEYKQAEAKYGIGSNFQIGANAIVGALSALAGGNAGGALAAASGPLLAQVIKQASGDNEAMRVVLHTVISGLLAQAQGGSAIGGAAGGLVSSVGAEPLSQLLYGKSAALLTQEQKELVANLATLAGMGAGAAVGGSTGAGSGGVAAKVEVENNWLSKDSPKKYTTRYKECNGEPQCEQNIRKDMAKESADNIQKLKSCWDAGDTVCVKKIGDTIELSEKAYTELRQQDNMAGRAYEDSAQHYADIIANCAGECGWLEAAIAKTAARVLTDIAYGALATGSIPKGGESSVKPGTPSNTNPGKTEVSNKVTTDKNTSRNVNPIGDVDSFVSEQLSNLNKKLGTKIGQGRLPYERSGDGVNQAVTAVKDTLSNATSVSDKIPAASVRGKYDLIHVYSAKTNSTVSLRVLPDGKYEFDTLISEKSSKIK
ncbi:VENN motif pre-toxin domain-containing protein [Erwinia rhapontici]|uniref:VENN motif pre-toxin domain-containing protein n=1 Tax=Erwinia rhapontici TaxID=55212 RepID=UPI001BCC5536|nr:VENN motif pre-toxin domain-containing protein [Erwinia rhapontici]